MLVIRAAHADSESLLHPNPGREQSAGAACTSLLWDDSRLGAAQVTKARLTCNPVLSCMGSISSVCSLKAAVASGSIMAEHCGRTWPFEHLKPSAHCCRTPATARLGCLHASPPAADAGRQFGQERCVAQSRVRSMNSEEAEHS